MIGEPAIEMAAEIGFGAGIGDEVERIGGEGFDQHAPRVGLGQAAADEIEEGGLVEIADRSAVAAFDVVGVDLRVRAWRRPRRAGSREDCG